ncbi:NAD(P)H dehydrogenase (quinone) [Pseudonocardia thermophila]|jgi:Predicted nucleoside-diphosphate-sugar epimerases|uniref:NAD(P)H dehydrogenase (Quinone) n=1 Tax=Pseudonocardia thermophila TaxID=1848 RepID=A0A1M6UJP5_PSETH|nr:NAD(P)H-binding protein [Pseudonocardia thermophila]SHK69389.1 NAD(P)H dehydrogenase (quinone) [Pseudonocardia thermophila]
MITVTGATGNLGGATIAALLETVPASELTAVVRNPAKAADLAAKGVTVRRGDYDDPDSLRAAFAGTDTLLLVSSPDTTPGVRPRQHGNAIDAAKASGVRRIVYTSAIGAENATGFLADHTVTEELLRTSGVAWTALRNTFYLHFLINPGLAAAVEAGELKAADGGRPVNFASVPDLAAAAAAALTEDGLENTVHELRGTVFTLPELAEVLAEVSGRPVAYRAVPSSEFGETAFMWDMIASGFFAEPSDDLENLVGRPPVSLRDAVAAALS